MKYLVLNTYGKVAIPLTALAMAEIKFVSSKWDLQKKKVVFWLRESQAAEGRIVEDSELLESEPADTKESDDAKG